MFLLRSRRSAAADESETGLLGCVSGVEPGVIPLSYAGRPEPISLTDGRLAGLRPAAPRQRRPCGDLSAEGDLKWKQGAPRHYFAAGFTRRLRWLTTDLQQEGKNCKGIGLLAGNNYD